MSQQPYPDEVAWWEGVFDVEAAKRYAAAVPSQPYPNPRSARWSNRTAYDIAAGLTKEQSMAKHLKELEDELSPPPQPQPGEPTKRPLIGPLRIEHKLFRDDTGYRRVFFDSWFNALRVLRDDPAKFYRWLDDTVRAGYQGSRIFLSVGGWTPYWHGYGVYPLTFREWYYEGNIMRTDHYGDVVTAWPDYETLLRTLLREYRKRLLRLHVTFGDTQIITDSDDQELALHDWLSKIIQQEGGTEVCALWETTNEIPMNRRGGLTQPSIEQMGRIIRTVQQNIPGVQCAMGAGLSEEPDVLYASSTYGEICAEHTTRNPADLCLKHTLGLVHWEGNYRGFHVPFWQGEPKGMNVPPFDDGKGDDAYAASNNPGEMCALYASHALTGQASNMFDGGSVKSTSDDQESAWGYDEIPAMLEKELPEDVATWPHANNGRGGIQYWFNGDRFATVSNELWDPSPPRPIADWTLYGDRVMTGTGTPPRFTGFLVGRFL